MTRVSLLSDSWARRVRQKLSIGDELLLYHTLLQDYKQEAAVFRDIKGETFLHCVARFGSIEMAKKLILLGADVNEMNKRGGTPLYKAVKWKTEMVQFLLENGADAKIIDASGGTILQKALNRGSVEIVDLLLKNIYKGYEDLTKSVPSQSQVKKVEEISKFLLSEGVDLNFREKINWQTPLDQRFQETIDGIEYFHANNDRYSLLLHFVLKYGDDETFRFVLHSSKNFDVNSKGPKKHTILHRAVHSEKEACVKYLIDFGADVNAQGENENTALHYACKQNNEALVRYFLDQGADVDKPAYRKYTALHYAVVIGNKKIIEMLLKAGADINAKFGIMNHYDASVLNLVCGVSILRGSFVQFQNEHFDKRFPEYPEPFFDEEMMEFLLERGADTEVYEEQIFHLAERVKPLYYDCLSPLQRAFREERFDLVNFLLSYGADINGKNKKGRTVLYQAIFLRNSRIIEFLLEKGLDINVRDNKGCTPLHHLIEANQDDTIPFIEFLVDNGADVNILNSLDQVVNGCGGVGPLQMAKRLDIIECLLELKADFRVQSKSQRIGYLQVGNAREYSPECNKVLIAFMALKEDELCDRKCYVTFYGEEEGVWDIFFDSCKIQVLKMMNKYISKDRNVTFFDFLNNDLLRAAKFGTSKEIMQVLDSEKYKEEFPHYAFLLEKRIERVKAMLRFENALIDLIIEKFSGRKFPIVVAEHILNFLEVKDFRNVARALSLIELNDRLIDFDIY